MSSDAHSSATPQCDRPGDRNLTLAAAARKTPPMLASDTEALLDLPKMRRYRLARLREQLAFNEIDACLLTSPYSIRYATGMRNGAIMQGHIPMAYLFVPLEGPTIYFDGEAGQLTAGGLETIDEIRSDVVPLSFMFTGDRLAEWMASWAAQVAGLLPAAGRGKRRLAVDELSVDALSALAGQGLTLRNAAPLLEKARAIKSPEEVLCMNHAIAVAEEGMWRMRAALAPGISECALWALLWQANVEAGGDWIEGRLLASGDRTNPWLQEASSRKVRAGELLCFDTDMVGPLGYSADISRAFLCGQGKPSAYQKELYQRAYDEVQHNIALMQPGASFRAISERCFKQPARFRDQHYVVLAHGVGLSDEWPSIYYPQDEALAYDGELRPGMTICVESYVGEVGGPEGVKLEEQILITEDANCILSKFPFEADFLTAG